MTVSRDRGRIKPRLTAERRVVITGIGVIAPNGQDLPTFWKSVVDGTPSAARVTRFDASAMHSRLASELRDFDPERWVPAKDAKRFDRAVLYTIAAGKQAVADANLDTKRIDPTRFGVFEGTSVCGLGAQTEQQTAYLRGGYGAIRPTRLTNAFPGAGSSLLATALQLTCHATTITTACSSGADAIGFAAREIQDDDADLVLAGATEAPLIAGYYSIFSLANLLSRKNDDPARAVRVFDRDRDGFVIGEGAAFLVLEELTHALSRGARIYGEVVGHGHACDAYDLVALDPDGKGAISAMKKALFMARMDPSDIDYINAHGSATATNDSIETSAIRAVYGAHAQKLQVSGTKAVTGHLMGASAAVEAAISALALYHDVVPPTPNLENPAPGCDLDYVPNVARSYRLRAVMSLSAGFGGKHTAIIFRKAT